MVTLKARSKNKRNKNNKRTESQANTERMLLHICWQRPREISNINKEIQSLICKSFPCANLLTAHVETRNQVRLVRLLFSYIMQIKVVPAGKCGHETPEMVWLRPSPKGSKLLCRPVKSITLDFFPTKWIIWSTNVVSHFSQPQSGGCRPFQIWNQLGLAS